MATPNESAVEFLLKHVERHGDGEASVQASSLLGTLPHVIAQREKDAAEAKKAADADAKDAEKKDAADAKKAAGPHA